MQDEDDRLRSLEVSQARVEEKLEVIRHDASNTRMMIAGISKVQDERSGLVDIRHGQLEADIKGLSKSLFQTALSVVGAAFSLIMAALIYFVSERMDQVKANTGAITEIRAERNNQ